MSMRMFEVKQSNDEEFDIEERFDEHSPPQSNLSAAASGDMVNDEDEGATDGEAAAIGDGSVGASSFVSYLPCFSVNKTIIGVSTMLVIGVTVAAVVAGMSINGAAQHSQIQKSFSAATNGKSGKSSFCAPTPAITCGQTFTGNVELSDDLICTDEVPSNPSGVLTAAIKVEGPNAVLDCKGHTIIQRSSMNPAFCSGSSIGGPTPNKNTKKNCDLFYIFGIWLVDGATAINCKVENFYHGIQMEDGGEVKGKKSEVAGNRFGLVVRDTVSITTKVSDLYAHGNHNGVWQQDESDGDNLIIKDVTIKNNLNRGLYVRDSVITVKDSIFASNGEHGIVIGEKSDDINNPTKVTFQGTVSSHQNEKNGVFVAVSDDGNGPSYAEVTVEGTLNTYLNKLDGITVTSKVDMDPFTVAKRASLNACENDRKDINNLATSGDVTFVNSGTLTCDSKGGAGKGDIPDCVSCPDCI